MLMKNVDLGKLHYFCFRLDGTVVNIIAFYAKVVSKSCEIPEEEISLDKMNANNK